MFAGGSPETLRPSSCSRNRLNSRGQLQYLDEGVFPRIRCLRRGGLAFPVGRLEVQDEGRAAIVAAIGGRVVGQVKPYRCHGIVILARR